MLTDLEDTAERIVSLCEEMDSDQGADTGAAGGAGGDGNGWAL
jgi:hypothetical protein